MLRNRFNYKTIEFEQIEHSTIKTGKELKNWLIILIIGLGLIGFAIYSTITIIAAFSDDSIDTIYIEEILIPVIPFFMGVYCVFMGLRKGKIMRIQTLEGAQKQVSLRELFKNEQLDDFKKFLSGKLQSRVRIEF